MADEITNDDADIVFDPDTLAMLKAIFAGSNGSTPDPATEGAHDKKASVKFMITMQDEKDLCELGYSPAQIARMKPQEAGEILQSGTKAAPDSM